MLLGYARATADPEGQEEQTARLMAAGCETVFQETDWKNRPGLAKALHALTFGDVLVVTRLDRIAWTPRDLFDLVRKLLDRGAGLKSLSEPWADPQKPQGREFLTMLEGMAQFADDGFRDRMETIRRDALSRGVKLGRGHSLTPEQIEDARADYQAGRAKMADLAERYAVNISTISRAINGKKQRV